MISRLINKLQNRDELNILSDIILPVLILLVFAVSMVWYYSNAFRATIHTTCKYQYFIFSPDKFSAGSATVFCKLADGSIVSTIKTAPWAPPTIDSEMQIDIPK